MEEIKDSSRPTEPQRVVLLDDAVIVYHPAVPVEMAKRADGYQWDESSRLYLPTGESQR